MAKLKEPVLSDLASHVQQIARMAEYLAKHETPVLQPACYVCGSGAADPMAAIHGFTYVRCRTCDHVYTTHRYSDEALERFYRDNEYYARITYANRETSEYRRDQVARPKIAFAEEHTGQPPGRWLDVGSGIGDIASVLMQRGWDATGLELSATSVAFAKDVFGIELLPQTMEHYAREHQHDLGTVDVVSFFAILEHVPAPMSLLRLAVDFLRPGGHVVIQVPNANSVSSMVQAAFPANVFRHMSPVSHIMLFTEQSLTRALTLAGFEPIAFWFLGLDVYELLNTLVLVNPAVQGSPLQTALMRQMNDLQLVFDQAGLSDGIICVARLQ